MIMRLQTLELSKTLRTPSNKRMIALWASSLVCLATLVLPSVIKADDWPQWLGPQRDGVWRESGLLEKFPERGPKVKWRVPVAGGYAGPAVADGRVFVADYVRSSKEEVKQVPGKRSPIEGTERVSCYGAADGKLLWKHEYDCPYKIDYPAGPRATPTVDGSKVYTLGAEGNLFCLDAAKGTVIWSHDLKKEYQIEAPMWGFSGHPLVDGNKLFCVAGGEGSVAVAFDKESGKEIWRALSAKEPGYAPPTLIEAGGKRQLLIWHAEAINGLDPETGKVYWSVPLKPDYGMAIMAPRKLGDYLFASGNGNVSVLLKLASDKPAVEEVWRGSKKTSFASINTTPFLEGETIYGVDQPGQLRAVALMSGERLWESFAPVAGRQVHCGTAFLIKNGDRFFLASETGDLIIAKLSPKGYEEISRWKMLDPTGSAFGRDVLWSHPAFANRCVFARNDKELICVSLAVEPDGK
jgi:outer membrane protein assembly factor BamB